MEEKNPCFYVILLLNVMAVSSYIQFVIPGTDTDSSKTHISQLPSGPYPYWSNRTVDGNFSQGIRACLHTAVSSGITEAWLRIDLQALRSVKYVKFWYRNDKGSVAQSTERLRGYSIRVSNTSDVSPGSTNACFTDDMSHTLPTVIQENCKKTTRYVWFYQPHARDAIVPILEICEVQIFECISGMYGNECNFKCSQFCHEELCYGSTGECVNGCEDGYIGGLCKTRCPNGYFGRKCLETCGKCLDDRTCDNVNGTCMDGCNEGLKGHLCKTACNPGEYGQNCQFRCSDHCHNNEVCNPFFGNCSKCEIGFQNTKCNEQCDDGYYGESCMFQCGQCLDDITCNNINGTCRGGCMSGWQNTEKCDKPCANGTFGVGCMHTCSGNCLNNETCEKRDGRCKNCAPGWEGHLCNKACDIGWFGLSCQHVCGHCFKAKHCFSTNGSCSGGCMEGFRGEMCSESVLRLTQDSDTAYVAVIAVLVVVIVALVTALAVHVVILRNTRKKLETNSRINEAEMYDFPNAKTENSPYDVISN